METTKTKPISKIQDFPSVKRPIIVPTSNYLLIEDWVEFAREKKALVLLIGENGYGKTTTLKKISSQIESSIYIKVGRGEPARHFYSRFLTEVDILNQYNKKEVFKNPHIFHLMDQSINIINERNDLDLILIDEFGNLDKRYISYVRQIWDEVQFNAGMVLAGPPSLMADLLRWQKFKTRGINELLSRIGSRRKVLKVHTYNDIKKICKSRGIVLDSEINHFYKVAPDLRVLQILIDDYKDGRFKI
ncbi:MAG: ATP-binding protein [Fulvivirga sp.]|uniref:ATP-binding protein n=1 Tax=Fulvivirga sp. TaxID=1931237 RepID=UPI0032ED0CD9